MLMSVCACVFVCECVLACVCERERQREAEGVCKQGRNEFFSVNYFDIIKFI